MEARIFEGIFSLIFCAGAWAFLSVHSSFKRQVEDLRGKLELLPCANHIAKIFEISGDMKALKVMCFAIKENVDFIRSKTL
jgi:hypothetical protein